MPDSSIQYVTGPQVDKQKWDDCISRAANGRIYSYSFYLDCMTPHWDALVLNDYETVMPLTGNKKYGIHYLFQPFLCAQLGITGDNITAPLVEHFLDTIPGKFRYWDISLNPANFFVLQQYPFQQRVNYLLDLNRGYEVLYSNYRENIRRNIRKAIQLGCVVKKDFPVTEVIAIAAGQMRNYGDRQSDFSGFIRLYDLLHARQKAVTYGIFSAANELLASCVFFFSHQRAYYILVGNHPNGKTVGASHLLIDAFIKENAGTNLLLDFEGSDIRNLAFFYSSFGATEEFYPALKLNRLPFYLKWLKK